MLPGVNTPFIWGAHRAEGKASSFLPPSLHQENGATWSKPEQDEPQFLAPCQTLSAAQQLAPPWFPSQGLITSGVIVEINR